MGQRHQAFIIARVVPHGNTDRKAYYRCLGAYHHQWLVAISSDLIFLNFSFFQVLWISTFACGRPFYYAFEETSQCCYYTRRAQINSRKIWSTRCHDAPNSKRSVSLQYFSSCFCFLRQPRRLLCIPWWFGKFPSRCLDGMLGRRSV